MRRRRLLLPCLIILILIATANVCDGWGTESKKAPKAKIFLSKNFPEFESNFDTPMPIINRYSYVEKIREMGWTEKEARIALEKNQWLLDEAVDYLSRYSNGLRHVVPCIGKNNCFISKKARQDTEGGSTGFSFREKLRGQQPSTAPHHITDYIRRQQPQQQQQQQQRLPPMLPQVHVVNYDAPRSSYPVEAPLAFIELEHSESSSSSSSTAAAAASRAKASGRLGANTQISVQGCEPLPPHIDRAARALDEELAYDPVLLEALSTVTVDEASTRVFAAHGRTDLSRLWRVVTQHLTYPALESYQYKRPPDRDVGFNHLDTHPPPPAGPMRVVPVAYPKPHVEDHLNICHGILPPSLPTEGNIAAGKGKPVAKVVNPRCKQDAWKPERKTSDFFVHEMQRRIKCSQKDWKAGPPGWLQARLRWEADMKKRQSISDVRGRGGYQLPQESWPVNVPVATQGKCCEKRDLWRKPLVPKTTALRKMTPANAKMKLEDAFSVGPPRNPKDPATGAPEAEQERPEPKRIGAHADDLNLSPIDDAPQVSHEQALKDYDYDREKKDEPKMSVKNPIEDAGLFLF